MSRRPWGGIGSGWTASGRTLAAVLVAASLATPALAQTGEEAQPPEAAEQAAEPSAPATGETEPGTGRTVSYAETLVVTASKREVAIRDAPVSVSVIGSVQIETAPADNYADLIRGMPGVNVIQLNNRDVNLSPRSSAGVLTNDQLVLVDGRSVYLDYIGVVVWDYLSIGFNEIDQIEVARGPGSAIWGANAVSGVINLRTKSPRQLEGLELFLEAGENGTRSASALWAAAREKTAYKVSASYYEQDAWERDDTLPDGSPLIFQFENSPTEQPNLDLRLDYEPDDRRTWSFKGGFGATSGIVHSGIGPFQIEKGTRVAYAEVDYITSNWDAKLYWNGLDGDAPNLVNGLPFIFVNDTYVVDATRRKVLGEKNLLVFGGSARANRFDLSIAPREDKRDEAGFFVEDSLLLGKQWAFNFGGRIDWFDTIGTVASPRVSVNYFPNARHSFRLAYSQAYRAPAQVENFIDTAVPAAIPLIPGQAPFVYFIATVGNENLDEVKTDAVELAYTAILGRLTLSAAAYRNEIRDEINFVPTRFHSPADPPPGWPLDPALVPPFVLPKTFSYLNFGQVRNQGLEVGATLDAGKSFLARFSYTYQDRPEVTNDGPLPLVVNQPPEHQASASLHLDRDRWQGTLAVSYTDEAFWADVLDQRFWGFTDDFVLVDASYLRRFRDGRYELVLRVNNLLDSDIQQHVYGDHIRRRATAGVRLRLR